MPTIQPLELTLKLEEAENRLKEAIKEGSAARQVQRVIGWHSR